MLIGSFEHSAALWQVVTNTKNSWPSTSIRIASGMLMGSQVAVYVHYLSRKVMTKAFGCSFRIYVDTRVT